VILDEIGRGTATYDGLAIAWACAEALHETNRCRGPCSPPTITSWPRWRTRLAMSPTCRLRAKEWNGDLVFLHEAAPGAADRSYGVQVAKLAGVPPSVVARARSVLDRLESEKAANDRLDDLPLFAMAEPTPPPMKSVMDEAVAALDPDAMSPREALEALYRLKALKG
jgi:DNA mismatch repair protein MutS